MSGRGRRRFAMLVVVMLASVVGATSVTAGPATDTIVLRGQAQTIYLYGSRGGTPVLVSSGDGGWVHLGPEVAEFLAARGCFVVGFDAKAYLTSFTRGSSTLRPEDEPGDYKTLIDYVARGGKARPLLIGVSEGAGLSVLAAADPRVQPFITGVIGLGLGDLNELGWRWRDAMIYVTHGMPDEPTFSTIAIAAKLAPVPLAAVHSTGDEYVPLAEIQKVVDAARSPKRLWVVQASNHRFGDNATGFQAALVEAMAWVEQQAVRVTEGGSATTR